METYEAESAKDGRGHAPSPALNVMSCTPRPVSLVGGEGWLTGTSYISSGARHFIEQTESTMRKARQLRRLSRSKQKRLPWLPCRRRGPSSPAEPTAKIMSRAANLACALLPLLTPSPTPTSAQQHAR